MPTKAHLRWICAGFFLAGGTAVLAAMCAYLLLGHPPVAVDDPPMPLERMITHEALDRRIRQDAMSVPTEGTEADLIAGAHLYRERCAVCHGLAGRSSDLGAQMFPRAPQLWMNHRVGVVGVSDDAVSETLWKVKNGIRLSGMPAFQNTLSFSQMWQVSLLLHQADQKLPAPVSTELNATEGATQP